MTTTPDRDRDAMLGISDGLLHQFEALWLERNDQLDALVSLMRDAIQGARREGVSVPVIVEGVAAKMEQDARLTKGKLCVILAYAATRLADKEPSP